ncbi:MAG: 3-deoxy-D-manno-octulosonic acid transferase [Rhodobacteraceae bacterium PARR1]|nr:MAG: 3-deoxy-D-manno-octulosonic acid transferase [Rhodobacteraceae bacterium PARR1]
MALSLGLTLYNLSNRREQGSAPDRPARPVGRLIWLHAPGQECLRAMQRLAARLWDEDGAHVLLTAPQDSDPQDRPRAGLIRQPPPIDTPAEARAFLTHWAPELAVFAEGEIRPALVAEAAQRKLPMMMVAGRQPQFLRDRDGWYPGLMRSILPLFRHILTVDEPAARAFRKAGAPPSHVEITGRMEEDSAALPCLEAERAALARTLGTRPVWLAASLPEMEETSIIAAHRAALRMAHRLILIIVPQDPARAEPLARRLEDEEGWSVALRCLDQEPEPETEVYVADSASEYGLWYRLAPITYLGGSLLGQGCGRDPLEPAALGSAIVYGPRPGAFGTTFGRLGAARAARAVTSGADLGDALGDLLSPDRTARLAQAAWTVASDGVEVTEHVLTLIRRVMDGED